LDDTTQTYDQLLGEYCGFRADIIVARACLEKRLDLSPEEQVALAARHIDAALLRTATVAAPYRLIDLRDGRVWDFQHAEDVTGMMFVLTMWPPRAAVYKHGRRFPGKLAGEIQELAQQLEAF
jgi:hypothetical protein